MTIHRWLRERNLRSYRPLRHLPLTPAHCRARLLWLLARSGWNDAEWGHIVFSDESRVQVRPDDRRRRVWRRPGQRADPAFTIACHTGPQPGVMVWAAISLDSWTPLVVIRGTLTAQRYVDDILRPVLLPFLLQYPGLSFQQDNARPHTAHVAMNRLTAYRTLPWPASSPDLSPIEHVFDMMGRRLHLPGNVDDLARQLEQIWQEIPQETIRELYHSMPRRVAACIQVRDEKMIQTDFELTTSSCVKSLIEDFGNLLKDEKETDMILKCGDETFPVHKTILSARSDVFAAMFRNNMSEKRDGIVEITDTDHVILKEFLQYLYSGTLSDINEDTAPLLYATAHKYAVDALQARCADFMEENLREVNACNHLILADTHGDSNLKSRIIYFIRYHEKILSGEEWLKLCDNHPKLSTEVYRTIYKSISSTTS